MQMSKRLLEISARMNKVSSTMVEKQINTNWNFPSMMMRAQESWGHFLEGLSADPARVANAQLEYMKEAADLWGKMMDSKAGYDLPPQVIQSAKGDRRFKNEQWDQSLIFSLIKQTYLLSVKSVEQIVDEGTKGMPEDEVKRIKFASKQMMDAFSPTNNPWTNPDVLAETMKTGGDNLLKGLEQLMKDVESSPAGLLNVRSSNTTEFEVGRNLAVTEGDVIFRNELIELIQYTPQTEKVQETPLLIVPPWINKYYILDMRPDNSFVKWCVEQGQTVFLISWVNPDARHKEFGFDEYFQKGILAALDVVEEICAPSVKTHILGYCIGGTLTAMGLSYLAKTGQADRIASATFLTTLLDFEHAGELKMFIDEDQLDMIEAHMAAQGYLEGEAMKAIFSALRANDLIWSFYINNYLLGREPFPFDLLFWNSDTTNMPAKLHAQYLRSMYLENKLVNPNEMALCGEGVDLGAIQTPAFFLSTEEDHIAPWVATKAGSEKLSGEVVYALAGSGHIAGVVNPPQASKYHYQIGDTEPVEGSWWPTWIEWLRTKGTGRQIEKRVTGTKKYKKLASAPGTYVK